MTSILNGPLIDTAVITAFACSVFFLVGYTKMAPWWRYAVGRAMVSLDAAVVLTLLPGILHLAFNISTSDTFFAWYRVVSLFVVAITTMWRLYTVHRVQSMAVSDRPSPETKSTDKVNDDHLRAE